MGDFAPPQKKPHPGTVETARAWSTAPKPKPKLMSSPAQQPVPLSARDIGNAFIEHGAGCDVAVGPECFLTSDQRSRLVRGYQLRVGNALERYEQALTELTVEKLIEKDADLSWV